MFIAPNVRFLDEENQSRPKGHMLQPDLSRRQLESSTALWTLSALALAACGGGGGGGGGPVSTDPTTPGGTDTTPPPPPPLPVIEAPDETGGTLVGKDTLYGGSGNDHFYLLDPVVQESFSISEAEKQADNIGGFNSGDKIVLPDGLDTLFIVGSGTTNLYLMSPTSSGMTVYGKIDVSSVSASSLAGNTDYFRKGDGPDNLSAYTDLTLVNVQDENFEFASTSAKEELGGTDGVDYFVMKADPEDWYQHADRVTYTSGDQIYITGLEEAGLDEGEIIVARFITVDP